MLAILKREITSYFSSAVGYIVLAAFYVFGGFYFYMTSLAPKNASLSDTFGSLFIILIFIIPLLTMRLFSEEKKQKTDQALLTAPVSLTSIVLGKFFAAVFMFFLCILITIVYAIVISFFTQPAWYSIFGNFFGLLLLGSALISIGMFLSSITENQIIAAVSCIAVNLFILMMNAITQAIPEGLISNILKKISFMSRYNNVTFGLLKLEDIIFFISVCVLFIFFTIRVFEKKRWS